ncbi:Ctr copper transporter family-domain-containing protein [Lineolata rhizophorae]|uniref:Copper transport protein n=1 Tax=Lineolata rhizophorae TaxID=578093 RepID=A0A6A6P219_9PEZI|nr:Ctr copper transporter family-domain-containing protein [Lineolata rhizophorae]
MTTTATAAAATMDMSSGHSHGAMDTMPASAMIMSFFTSTGTPLYSSSWAPATVGQYAGTCIFLIVLGIVYRCLFAAKQLLERRWHDRAVRRRYVVVADKMSAAERAASPDGDELHAKNAVLTTHGVQEHVKVLHDDLGEVQPWRFSTDLPRAALVTVIVGVGYLLMLAVMTMNVGYFMSVLAGAFVGDLAVGRYAAVVPH